MPVSNGQVREGGKMQTRVEYRGWVIRYDPCVPAPYCDWAFEHDDFDGAPDANDNRYGYASTLDEAKREIDIREDEES